MKKVAPQKKQVVCNLRFFQLLRLNIMPRVLITASSNSTAIGNLSLAASNNTWEVVVSNREQIPRNSFKGNNTAYYLIASIHLLYKDNLKLRQNRHFHRQMPSQHKISLTLQGLYCRATHNIYSQDNKLPTMTWRAMTVKSNTQITDHLLCQGAVKANRDQLEMRLIRLSKWLSTATPKRHILSLQTLNIKLRKGQCPLPQQHKGHHQVVAIGKEAPKRQLKK